jgi:hypothetical protein
MSHVSSVCTSNSYNRDARTSRDLEGAGIPARASTPAIEGRQETVKKSGTIGTPDTRNSRDAGNSSDSCNSRGASNKQPQGRQQ